MRVVALMFLGAALGTSALAVGQDRGGRPPAPAPSTTPAPTGAAKAGATDARSAEVVETGGSKVKVMEFSGFDISGRLKSPQLLYFLNRLRAQFNRPRLPHRSFIPELERSAHGKAL